MCYLLEDKLYKLAFTNREGMVTKILLDFSSFTRMKLLQEKYITHY